MFYFGATLFWIALLIYGVYRLPDAIKEAKEDWKNADKYK